MTQVLDNKAVVRAMQNAGAAVTASAPGIGVGAADDRTTAQGLFVYADAYLASAESLVGSNLRLPHAQVPQRALTFHAAELYLKSFLRLRGCTVEELRSFGHRFSKLIDEADKHGLSIPADVASGLVFSDQTEGVIGSRYIQTGFARQWPLEAMLKSVRVIRDQIVQFPGRKSGIIVWGEGA